MVDVGEPIDRVAVLSWQFRLAWSLGQDVHLHHLTDDMCRWRPNPDSWTVRRVDGRWWADWADPEPTVVPTPTIGWLTWHIAWWWTDAFSVLRGGQSRDPHEVEWAGSASAVVAQLTSLANEWTEVLAQVSDAELVRPVAYPWPTPRPIIYTLAWVNSELMKNIAEIGQLITLYRHRTASP